MKMLSEYKIRKIFFTLLMFSWLPTGWAFAQQIRVVATFPDLADITEADRQRAGERRESSHRGRRPTRRSREAKLRAEIESSRSPGCDRPG